MGKVKNKLCLICGTILNESPESMDCGGDCLQCMADTGDPSCQVEMLKIAIRKLFEDYRTEGCADPDCIICRKSKKAESLAKKVLDYQVET